MPIKRKLRSKKHKRHTLKKTNKKTKNLHRNKKTKRNLPRNKKTKRKRGGTYSLNNNRGKCTCKKTGVTNGKQIANCECWNNQIINRSKQYRFRHPFQNANNKQHNSAKGNQNMDDKYLENVRVKYRDVEGDVDVNLKNILLNPTIINFPEAEKNIKIAVSQQARKAKGQTYKWITCNDNCGKTLKTELEKEFASTAFMLRILTNSIIKGVPEQDPSGLIFKIKDYSELTGIWEKDNGYIDMEPVDEKPKRLIMGFGPSASGKTFWAKKLIAMLEKDDFPDTFMSIDGGLIREYSHIYQSILNFTPSNIMGFANLAGGTKLANTSPIKTNLVEYLKLQKIKNNNICPVSIYVPETLARCKMPLFSCKGRYDKFIRLTGDDKWIGVYIWQHKDPEKATNMRRPPCNDGLKCVGSVNSGKKREKGEGKIYSSEYYDTSEKYGIQEMKHGKGGRIDIHNSGGREINGQQQKSTITEYSINGDYILTEAMVQKFNSEYIKIIFDRKREIEKLNKDIKDIKTKIVSKPDEALKIYPYTLLMPKLKNKEDELEAILNKPYKPSEFQKIQLDNNALAQKKQQQENNIKAQNLRNLRTAHEITQINSKITEITSKITKITSEIYTLTVFPGYKPQPALEEKKNTKTELENELNKLNEQKNKLEQELKGVNMTDNDDYQSI